jgi:hypothetical protein
MTPGFQNWLDSTKRPGPVGGEGLILGQSSRAGDMAVESSGKSEPSGSSAAPAILSGWKQIACYLGKSIRTVQRWEHDLGLPVRKTDMHTESGVSAIVTEIEIWGLNRTYGYPCTGSTGPK